MSGSNEQQRDTGGRRGWWLVGLLAVSGAAVGAYAGYRLDPDVIELAISLGVAGIGLGGLIGLVLLAPVGLVRAWRRRRARGRAAASERADLPDDTGLWHTDEPEHEAAAERDAVEAPPADTTETERPEEPASPPQEQPESERVAPEEKPEPEPEEPSPPPGEEPGWYPDPAQDGVRRYWDGQAWTGHVWRGRSSERTRKARNRR